MKDLLRIASLLDYSGQYKLSDKLFKIADQGKVSIPILRRELGKLLHESVINDYNGNPKIDIKKLQSSITNNFYLRPYINSAQLLPTGSAFGAQWDPYNKTILIGQIDDLADIEGYTSLLEHEMIHTFDKGLDVKQQRVDKFYPGFKRLDLSYEDNIKLQGFFEYLQNENWGSNTEKRNLIEKLYWSPEEAFTHFDKFMREDGENLNKWITKAEQEGVFFNNQYMNKEAYEAFQKQNINKIGRVSPLKYFDMTGEPTAWMAQIDQQFSPHNFVKWYSQEKSSKLKETPEAFISRIKKYLSLDQKYWNIRFLAEELSYISRVDSSNFYDNITDPKIKRQILARIAKNISRAEILLKGGVIKLSNLELRTLSPEFAEYIKSYLKDLPIELQKKFYITQDIYGNFKGRFEGIVFDVTEYQNLAGIANWDKPVQPDKVEARLDLPFSQKLGNATVPSTPDIPNTNQSSTTIYKYCNNDDCPKFNEVVQGGSPTAKFCKGCGTRLRFTTDFNSIPKAPKTKSVSVPLINTQETDKNTKRKSPKPPKAPNPTTPRTTNAPKKPINSSEIAKKTSSIPQFKGKSSVQSISALSKVLPTIKKIFTELSLKLDKFYNTPAGRVFSKGMLAKDVLAVILLTNNISKQIKNGEQVMLKDQMDLGLTIVSILTDQETHKILEAVYPPIIPFLENPEVKKWMFGINIGANLLSGAITVTDYISTRIYTTNKSEGATSGVMNTPGSLQALVMPVFQLREKYGEVYNALIDVEKGMAIPQAISKHIMVDASGGIEPYRLSLFYKFRNSKDKIIQYQNSPAFKKLPAQNQLLYPNANSAYAISSYKKARDAARVRQEEARRNNVFNNFGPGSGYPIRSPF